MKNSLLKATIFVVTVLFLSWSSPKSNIIAAGEQPQVSMDVSGTVRIVFGRKDSIFYATSKDKGTTFSNPVLVSSVPKMHLGMTRGPQIASSKNYSLITAMDEGGTIHFFLLNHINGGWISKGIVNDVKASAPEGLMSVAADDRDHFYAVWLDIRQEKSNNIYFSSLAAKEGKWSKNLLVYQSPDKHVCECCKPGIAVRGSQVAIQFRNWLNGSRDLYYAHSSDGGKTFSNAQKLGSGTWKLNGCPMDGGGIAIDKSNAVHTVWQREGIVYYCRPGENEIKLARGRTCSIAENTSSNKGVMVAMQEGGNVKVVNVNDNKETIVGKGTFLKSIIVPDEKVLCIWEEDKEIKFTTL